MCAGSSLRCAKWGRLMSDRIPKEQFIAENGFLIVHPVGSSMLPLLRGGKDTVELAAAEEIKCGDVVWYRRADGSYILHRVVEVDGDSLALCGDWQTVPERAVQRADVLGVMRGFYRGERYVSVENIRYRAYSAIWRSMVLRRAVKKLYRIFHKS